MYATANLDLKMADICIRLQGRYFIKLFTFMANYFTLHGYSLWGNKLNHPLIIRKTIKTNMLNAWCVLVIFSVFTSCRLVFLNYSMLITVTVNHRHTIYQRHTVQSLWNIINLNYHFEHINMVKQCNMINQRNSSLNDNH